MPGVFLTLLSQGLTGLSFAMHYLGDLIVYSITEDEHLYLIHSFIVLDRLKQANLKIKVTKCSFLKKEIHYVGHFLSPEGEGIKCLSRKLASVHELKEPSNVKKFDTY